jgi:SAM-dependent methyltransferase
MGPDFESTDCLVCAANDFETISQKGQFGLPSHVVVCRKCGFSYMNPRWTKKRYDHFYTVEYDRYYRPEVLTQNDENYRYEPVKKILARLKDRNIQPKFEHVLDIGSGMGHALIYLRKNEFPNGHYDAIEPSENCKGYLLENGINYLSNDVFSGWEKSAAGKYDFIIMRHVLEHFHEPFDVLKKAQEALAEDGILYVAVPDSFHPTKPLRSHFFRVVHISYFSKISLSNLLRKAGLEIIEIVEGDQYEKSEIFALCKKGKPADFIPDPSQFEIQKNIYAETGKNDLYYEMKGKLISLLRKLHLLK